MLLGDKNTSWMIAESHPINNFAQTSNENYTAWCKINLTRVYSGARPIPSFYSALPALFCQEQTLSGHRSSEISLALV